jgi:hypothetical protein
MLLLFRTLLWQQVAPPEPPAPPEEDMRPDRSPVFGRGPGVTIDASHYYRQARQQSQKLKRRREEVLFI